MSDRAVVPCGSCHLCCKMMTQLMPERGDDPSQYQTAVWLNPTVGGGKPMLILDRKDNGDCVYLGPDGCTIHDRAPFICRDFDCRQLYRSIPRRDRKRLVRQGKMSQPILSRGRELIESER